MFQVGDVIRKAVEDFKRAAVPLILALVIAGAISGVLALGGQVVLGLVARAAGSPAVAVIGGLALFLALVVVQSFFALGLVGMTLKTVRGEVPTVGDLFAQGSRLVPGTLANLLVGIVTGIGSVLLLVPGVIAAIALCLTLFFVVDEDLDPISALKASFAATKGSWLSIFLFGLAAFGLTIVGTLLCGVGLLVVNPVLALALARIYEALKSKAQIDA